MIEFNADKNRKLSKLALYHVEDLSYSAFQKLLRAKDIKVNGKRVGQDVSLSIGDKVEIYYNPQPVDKFSTIYKDENIIVVNKKSGYTSEAVFEDLKKLDASCKFIHRLDRNTSGVMIFAFNEECEKILLDGFKNRCFDKRYIATVYGVFNKKQDVLTAYLLKDAESALVKIYNDKVEGAVPIKTGYKVIEEFSDRSVVEVTLYTGKTHQIRAHFAHLGHFVLGDGKYGNNEFNRRNGIKKQMLQASSLTLYFEKDSALSYLNGKTFKVNG